MSDTKAITSRGTLFTPFNVVAGLILLIGLIVTVLRFTGAFGSVSISWSVSLWPPAVTSLRRPAISLD